jgi:hypothetical protein
MQVLGLEVFQCRYLLRMQQENYECKYSCNYEKDKTNQKASNDSKKVSSSKHLLGTGAIATP